MTNVPARMKSAPFHPAALINAAPNGNIWVGSDTMRKYTKDGKLLGAIERVADETNPKPGAYPADTQKIVAVAQVSDGSFWSDEVEVIVTLAACLEGA